MIRSRMKQGLAFSLIIPSLSLYASQSEFDALASAVILRKPKELQQIFADLKSKNITIDLSQKHGELTLLVYAVNGGSSEIVRLLLENGSNPVQVSEYLNFKQTPIGYAAFANRVKILKLLISQPGVSSAQMLEEYRSAKLMDLLPEVLWPLARRHLELCYEELKFAQASEDVLSKWKALLEQLTFDTLDETYPKFQELLDSSRDLPIQEISLPTHK